MKLTINCLPLVLRSISGHLTQYLPLALHFISGNWYVGFCPGLSISNLKANFNIASPCARRSQLPRAYNSSRSRYTILCAPVFPAINLCLPTGTSTLGFFVKGGIFLTQHSPATNSQCEVILTQKFTSFRNILRQRKFLNVRLLNLMCPSLPSHHAMSTKMFVDTRQVLSP